MCAPLEAGGVIRILCDGDSTTLGTGGTTNGAYRLYLAQHFWDDALDDFYAIDFVGGQSDASFANASHWGHAGSTIEDHDTGGDADVAPHLSPADARLRPDICIRQLGVNGSGTPEEKAAAMRALLERDHAARPDLIWILCTITPHESPATDALHVAYNFELTKPGGVVDQCRALGMTIYVADCHAALDPDLHLTSGAHPNDLGYELEADTLLPVIYQALGREPP